MFLSSRCSCAIIGLCVVVTSVACVWADDHLPTDWLPESTTAYLSVAPAETILDHHLRKQILKSPVFRKIWLHPDFKEARLGLIAFEFAVGQRLDELLRQINHGGVHIAYDQVTEGVVVLAKTQSEDWLAEYLLKLKNLARNDAKSKGKSDPIQESDYRQISCTKFQESIIASLGPWLMVTNKGNLANQVIDRFLDGGSESLTSKKTYVAAQAFEKESKETELRIASLFLDLPRLRELGVAMELFETKQRDFGAELILGGVLASLQNSPFSLMDLSFTKNGLRWVSRVPFDSSSIGDLREFFVGPNFQGVAPRLLMLPESIASLSVYRNLSQLWLRAGDLFDDQVNDQLSQADNTLTTLFSGKDFGEDILGAIQPEIQMVVAKQKARSDGQSLSINLPAVALVGQLKDPGKMQRELKRIFQSAIGFLNIAGAIEGKPQLELMSDGNDTKSAQYHWAEFLIDSDKKYENGLPIQFNFTPCVAFSGSTVVFSSTMDLAKTILDSNKKEEGSERTNMTPLNSELRIKFSDVRDILDSNREALITNNMLEKGHGRDKAQREIDLLLSILDMLDDLHGVLRFENEVRLSIEVNTKEE